VTGDDTGTDTDSRTNPSNDRGRVLTTDVDIARSHIARACGLMFRAPESYPGALVISFDRTARRGIHTLFVRAPIDVVWTDDGTVTAVGTLPAWRGVGFGRADAVVEFPAETLNGVAVGDRLVVEDDRA
jgi:uncharacterized membrane protein (UPF0127 family)